MTQDSDRIYAELHAATSGFGGAKLFTVTVLDRAARLSRRSYTSHPAEYPVSGTKPMTDDGWSRQVIGEQLTFVANHTVEFARFFGDHALINSLGCQSAVNIPVIDGGQVVATVNLLDVENHFTPDRVAGLKALVASRTPDILAAIRMAPPLTA